MNQLVPLTADRAPALVTAGGARASYRFFEFFTGAGLRNDPKAFLFQTYSRATGQLTSAPLLQANAYAMI